MQGLFEVLVREHSRMLMTYLRDSQTGVARRVILNWQRNRLERGPIQWKIELVGSPELAGGWFQLDGHVEQGRPTIRIRSAADLDTIEIQKDSYQ